MSNRIIVSVSNDLIGDQRINKVCTSLHNDGYKVLLVGCIKKKRTPLNRPYETARFRVLFKKGSLFYAEFNIRLFFYLLVHSKTALLANDTDSLLANYCASKLSRIPLVFDAHELFPELPEVIHRKRIQQIWRGIEDRIFPHLKQSYTVCQSIATYYHQRYGINMGVVRNIPFHRKVDAKMPLPTLPTEKKILLYQGAINVGRGVDWVIKAMPFLPNCHFCICGEGDLIDEMKQLAQTEGVAHQVQFTGRVPLEALLGYTQQADLGFVFSEDWGLSYHFSLPNRIFDYMHAGVPVLASDLPEISNIVLKHQTGTLIHTHEPQELAAEITKILIEWEQNPQKRENLKQVATQFTWENEEKVILATIQKAINHTS